MNIKGIVFDWAGTIIDYGCIAPVQAICSVFNNHGVQITIDEARGPMGLNKKDHINELLKTERIKKLWEEKFGRPPSITDIDNLFFELEPALCETVKKYAEPIPGIIDLLSKLRANGIKIGSSTGYSRKIIEVLMPIIREKGIILDSVVCSTDVPSGRPSPWMCYMNSINMGIYPASSMIKIGDTVNDIEEGLNAGMWTIGVVKSGNGVGYPLNRIISMEPDLLMRKINKSGHLLKSAGAHHICDGIWDVYEIIEIIDRQIERGEIPNSYTNFNEKTSDETITSFTDIINTR